MLLTLTLVLAHAGNEAGAYLQFFIDHYDCLPKVLMHAHARRCKKDLAWRSGQRPPGPV